METIEELKKIIREKDGEIAVLNQRIINLQEEVEELEMFEPETEDQGNSYKICGETVMIRVDNIAHETFFEKLEEFSKKCSIQELTNAMINLKSMSAR